MVSTLTNTVIESKAKKQFTGTINDVEELTSSKSLEHAINVEDGKGEFEGGILWMQIWEAAR
jgi:hypothetical protein